MKRILVISLLSLACLVLLVALALGVLLATVNPNDHKENISAAVLKATGRTVVFEGPLSTSIFPVLALKAQKLRLEDDAAFGGEPFLFVQNASFSLAFMPLLSGEVQVKEIEFEGVRLKLAETVDGRNNWDFSAKKSERSEKGVQPLAEADAKPKGAKDKKDLRLEVRSVIGKDIQITYRNLADRASYTAQIKELHLSNLRPGADAPIELAAAVRDEVSGLGGAVALKAVLRWEENGDIALSLSSLEADAGQQGVKPLHVTLKADARYGASAKTLDVRGLKGEIGGGAYEGELNVRLSGAQGLAPGVEQDVRGTLRFGDINVDALAAPFAGEHKNIEKAKASEPQASSKPSKPLVVTPPANKGGEKTPVSLYVDVVLTAKSVTVAKLPFTNVEAHIVADKGLVHLQPYSLRFFEGAVTGKALADFTAKPPRLSATNTVKGLHVRPLMAALSGKGNVAGIFSSEAQIEGRGLAWPELAPTLTGKGHVLMTEGEVQGFTLIPAGLPGLKAVPANFPVERVSASYSINRGVVSTNDILMLSPVMEAKGGGSVNLPQNQLSMLVNFLLGGVPPAVPVVVAGSLESPSTKVDMETFVKNAATGVLTAPEETGKLIKDAGKGIGDLFKKKR